MMGLSGEHGAGLGLSKGDSGLVGRKSLALGMGPIDSSMFVAQSNVMFATSDGMYADRAVSWPIAITEFFRNGFPKMEMVVLNICKQSGLWKHCGWHTGEF